MCDRYENYDIDSGFGVKKTTHLRSKTRKLYM